MIKALIKADQVRVLGESAIVPHNPPCRCSFSRMKRSKKKGYLKARATCAAATELSFSPRCSISFSNALPLSLFPPTFLFVFFALMFITGHVVCGGQRPALCRDFNDNMPCALRGVVKHDVGLCDSVFSACTALTLIIRHQRKTHTCAHPHTSHGLYSHVFLYPSSRGRKKPRHEGRKRYEMKARGAQRESK